MPYFVSPLNSLWQWQEPENSGVRSWSGLYLWDLLSLHLPATLALFIPVPLSVLFKLLITSKVLFLCTHSWVWHYNSQKDSQEKTVLKWGRKEATWEELRKQKQILSWLKVKKIANIVMKNFSFLTITLLKLLITTQHPQLQEVAEQNLFVWCTAGHIATITVQMLKQLVDE